MPVTWRRSRTRVVGWALVPLLTAGGTMGVGHSAGQASPPPIGPGPGAEEPAGGFRQFPGGRIVPNLRAGFTPRLAAAALRADAEGRLPEGLRLRDDGEPFVAPVGGNRVFRFGLEYRGVRLAAQSTYVAIVGRNGKLLSSRFQNVPHSVDATAPTVDASAALAVATDHARGTLGQSGTLSATTPVLEVWVDARQQGRLSWSLTLREASAGTVTAATQYQVAAIETPDILSWADIIRYDNVIHAQVDVWDLSPNQPTVVSALSSANLTVNSTLRATDQDGNVVVPANPPGLPIRPSLIGPFARVSTAGGTGGPFGPLVTTAGGDETVHFAAATEFALAQTTAFTWTTYANRWVREVLPFLDASPTVLNEIRVFVNENISCNAFSTGDTIHFGRATSSCNNMATATIVVHEFGHSLDAVLGGLADASYSEGFGDALAALVTEQPCLGPGRFRSSEVCIRDATDVTTWPVSSSDPHEIGKPYAQFVWALTDAIGFEATTEIVLGTGMAGPAGVPDAVRLSFVVADDDGLLGTCSPHQRALEQAADSRLLPRPPDCRPAGDNQPPTATDDTLSLIEDEVLWDVDLVGNDIDPDGDPLVVTDVQPGLLGSFDCSPMPCLYRPRPNANGTESLTYTVIDTYGGQATATVHIQIAPVEDVLSVGGHGDIFGQEDAPIPVSVVVFDPDGPAFTMRWFVGTAGSPAPCTFAEPLAASTTLTCTHEGSFPFGVVVTQGGTERVEPLGIAEIANTRPSVVITAPTAGSSFAEQTTVEVAAAFDDGPTPGPHTCTINWGDGTLTAGAVGVGTCTGSHVYAPGSAGPRQIVVSVLDAGLAGGTAVVSIVITSTGPTPCVPRPGQTCTAAGVGTVGRQQPVAFEFTVGVRHAQPVGQMLLLDGSWRFFTIAIRSLTIVGDRATFAGTGLLNGRPGHTFEATVADNRRLGGSGPPDTMRVVVRGPTGAVVRTIEGEVTRGDIVVD